MSDTNYSSENRGGSKAMYSLPLSQDAVDEGILWLIADGVRNTEEARDAEQRFIEDIKSLKPFLRLD